MRLIIWTLLATSLLFSCGNDSDSDREDISLESNSTFDTEERSENDNLSNEPVNPPSTSVPQLVAEGDYAEYYPNGALKIQGNLNEMDEREGLWVSYYDNGVKWSELNYRDGMKNGHSITFYPNGRPRYLGEYKDNEKLGTWTFYTETGEVSNEIEY